MKKILALVILYFCIVHQAHGQTLDYTNYGMTYYDEFNYTPATFQTDPAFTGGGISPAGFGYGNWHIGDCAQCALGAEIWDPGQVTMPTPGTLRLTATQTPYHFDNTCSHTCGGTDSPLFYREFLSGWINTNQNFGPFGIIEAKINVPSGHPFPAFYMDNDHISLLPIESWGSGWRAHLTSDYNIGNYDYGFDFIGTENVYHLFSVKWTPNQTQFYYDGSLLTSIPYTIGRTNYSQLPIKIDLATCGANLGLTTNGIVMDIAYVKVWTMNCKNETYNLQDHNMTQIIPGLYKYAAITSGDPSTMTQTVPGDATVFEAESITLLPNFLADESTPTTISQVVMGDHGLVDRHITRVANGYFEIVPAECKNCDLGPISGPDVICDPFNSWSNSTPGGVWSTNDLEIVINPVTGDISTSPSFTPFRSFFIFYTVGGCTVSKKITADDCREGGKPARQEPPIISNTASGIATSVDSSLATNSNQPVEKSTGATATGKPSSTEAANSYKNSYAQIQVTPNPAQEKINITYPCKSAGQLAITIKDTRGRVLYVENIACSEGDSIQHSVDIANLTPGVYFISLTLNDQQIVKKIVKL